jgi:HAD superfamily hydrolase (TIGR01509 family)
MKQKYTLELIERNCIPEFQKIYMLKKLKEKGYQLAVCSNAILNSVEIMLKKSRLWEYFDFVLSNEDVTYPKPDPDIYLKAFEKLKLKPKECLIVEDAEHGKRAAQDSGGCLLEVTGYQEVNYEKVANFLKRL